MACTHPSFDEELLGRYPVFVRDDLADDEQLASDVQPTELASVNVIDLDSWIVHTATVEPTTEPDSSAATIARDIEEAESAFMLPAFYFARRSDLQREVEEVQLALDFG